MSPDLIKALVDAGALVLSVLTGAATAIWVVIKWRTDRDQQRRQEAKIQADKAESERIEQEKRSFEEDTRRAKLAAELMAQLGKASTAQERIVYALTLSLFPQDSVRLLVTCLGHFENDSVTELLKMNRIGQIFQKLHADDGEPAVEPLYDPGKLLSRSKSAINQILLQLSEEELASVDLANVDLSNTNFGYSNLAKVDFRKACLTGCDFRRAKLQHANMSRVTIEAARFTNAHLKKTDLTESEGSAGFIGACLDEAILDFAKLMKSNLDAASLKGTSMKKTDLSQAALRGSRRQEATLEGTNLIGIEAYKMAATNAIFSHVNLGKANLKECHLNRTQFESSVLTGARLEGARLREAKLSNCNFSGADFSGTDLTAATFAGCKLRGTKLKEAKISGTTFKNCDLTGSDLPANGAGIMLINCMGIKSDLGNEGGH